MQRRSHLILAIILIPWWLFTVDQLVALFSYVNSLLGFFALRIGRFLRGDVLFFFLFVVIDKVLVFFVISHGCYYFGVCVCCGWWLVVRVGFFMVGIFLLVA